MLGSGRARASAPALLLSLARELPMLPVILVFGVVLSLTVDGFMSVPNIQNILRQISVILIAATGETLVILIGGIDLSVGATIGLASVTGAYVMHVTDSTSLGIVTCIAVGVGVGAVNGFGIARIGIQPFIMTFAMLLTVRASAFLVTGGRSVGALPKNLLVAGRLNVADLPFVFIIGIVIAVLGGLILSYTKFGQEIYLTGSNARAAAFSGVNVKRLIFFVYLITGTLAGFAAFVFMMRLGAATPNAGDPLLLQIIGSVLVGGNAMTGGEGGLLRSITGALLIAMLVKSMEIIGAQFWDQLIVVGALVALGSALGAWLSRRRTSETKGRTEAPLQQKVATGGPSPG
jgi:ribose/xylose/arabinose/galactoside ABC-type transport system permease subunit